MLLFLRPFRQMPPDHFNHPIGGGASRDEANVCPALVDQINERGVLDYVVGATGRINQSDFLATRSIVAILSRRSATRVDGMLFFFVPHNQHTLTLGAPPSGRLSAKAIPIYTPYLAASARIEAGGENWSTGPRTSDTPAHLDGHFLERLKILGRAYNSLAGPGQ
jgi:hypothetical protein